MTNLQNKIFQLEKEYLQLKNNQVQFQEKIGQNQKDKELLSLEVQGLKVEKEDMQEQIQQKNKMIEEFQKLNQLQKNKYQKMSTLCEQKFVQIQDQIKSL